MSWCAAPPDRVVCAEVTGLPSASSATLVAGELDVRFVEHSVDGAERLGVTAHQLFSALAAFADQPSTLPLEGPLAQTTGHLMLDLSCPLAGPLTGRAARLRESLGGCMS